MKYLWGEYYLDLKSKKISKKQQNSKQNIMFVDLILKNIQLIYDKLLMNPVSNEDVKTMINKMELFNWEEIPVNIQQ